MSTLLIIDRLSLYEAENILKHKRGMAIQLEGFRGYTTKIFRRQLNLIISSEKLKDLHFLQPNS